MPLPSSPRWRRSPTPAYCRSTVKWSIARISCRHGAFSTGRTGKKAYMAEAVHPVPEAFKARIGPDELAELHRFAYDDPDAFWLEQAKRLTWNKSPTKA